MTNSIGAGNMLTIVVAACMIVFAAMAVDLVSGLHKAKLRGETKRSWGLKRTVSKFILYEGAMLIAAGIDVLIQMSNLLRLFGVTELCDIPFMTCIAGIFLCVVEGLSVREKADEKTQREFVRAQNVLMSKEELAKIIAEVINIKKDGDKTE